MQNSPKYPDELGHLILNEDGAVISSSGDLQNDERLALVIMNILTSTTKSQLFPSESGEQFKKLTITYSDHFYVIRLSNKKIDIVKRKHWIHSEPIKV
ncbi:UNVERIFIED_CONTAM: hypothetical protein RMT77_004872 [Armadillidium vulgare]